MIEPLAPLVQIYVPPPEAESVVLVPVVMVTLFQAVAVGTGFTVMDALAVSEQLPVDTITEYVVLAEGETFMAAVVLPLLQE